MEHILHSTANISLFFIRFGMVEEYEECLDGYGRARNTGHVANLVSLCGGIVDATVPFCE